MLATQKIKYIIAVILAVVIGVMFAILTKNIRTFGAALIVAAYFGMQLFETIQNEKKGKYTATITAANNWKYTFSKLPKFFNEGTQIEYTLAEDAASGYSNVIEKKDNYTFVLTNKYSPATVDIPVVKKWNDDNDRDGARPESVNIVLNGSDGKLYTGTLSAENGYTYVFQSVPKFHNSGTLISYTVAEEQVTGYL